jgi:surface protein
MGGILLFGIEAHALSLTVDTSIANGSTNDKQFKVFVSDIETGFNYSVDCDSDGTYEAQNLTGSYTCEYPQSGRYDITIDGTFPKIRFGSDDDKIKLVALTSWGTQAYTSFAYAFYRASNLEITAGDIPNVSNVTNFFSAFSTIKSFSSDTSEWDVSRAETMFSMFGSLAGFNQNVSDWNVSRVTNMAHMFSGCYSFNQDLSKWDVSHVENMKLMFQQAINFNQDIGDWDVSRVEDMYGMFKEAYAFNQDIGDWDVSRVNDMYQMFYRAHKFNQDIGDWNVSRVDNMEQMFDEAYVFNQDIGDWDVSRVNKMNHMFSEAKAFNQNLGDWNIENVLAMYDIFADVNLSVSNYDDTLFGWDSGQRRDDIDMNSVDAYYCNELGRLELLDSGWIIDDLGENCDYVINEFSPSQLKVLSGSKRVVTISTHANNATPAYSIAGGSDGSLFTIERTSGLLSFKAAPDYFRPKDSNRDNIYRVQVKSTDGAQSDVKSLKVEVLRNDGILTPVIMYLLN